MLGLRPGGIDLPNIGWGLRFPAVLGGGDALINPPFPQGPEKVGDRVWKGETGESGRCGVDTMRSAGRKAGESGPRIGRVSSVIGRSSFDILICCLTAVSLNCPRCAYPYDVSITASQSTIRHDSKPTSRSEIWALRAASSTLESTTIRSYLSLASENSARKVLISSC